MSYSRCIVLKRKILPERCRKMYESSSPMDWTSGCDAASEPYVAISKTQYDQMRLACELLHAGTKHMENTEQLLQSCQRNDIETLVKAWIPERSNPDELFRRCLDNHRKELFEINGNSILDEVKHISESLLACISNSWDTTGIQ